MGPQVVHAHERLPSLGARAGYRSPPLGTKNIGRTAWSQPALAPALAPVDEPKTVNLILGAGGLNQPLPTTAFPAPDPCESGMKRKLDLILEIDISVRQA